MDIIDYKRIIEELIDIESVIYRLIKKYEDDIDGFRRDALGALAYVEEPRFSIEEHLGI